MTVPTALQSYLLFQVDVKDGMSNAMFDAKSPSDFWGRKWNHLVHGLLKVNIIMVDSKD